MGEFSLVNRILGNGQTINGMNIKLETAIYLLGIFQATQVLFLGWKTHKKSKKSSPFINVYLVVFIVCICLELMDSIFTIEGLYYSYPNLLMFTGPIIVLFGPMIYFYSLSLSTKKSERPSILPHLVMFFVWVLMYIPFVFFTPASEKIALLNSQSTNNTYLIIIIAILPLIEFIQIFYYLYKSKSHINSYQNNLTAFYSYQKNISLSWISRIIYSIIVLTAVYFFDSFINIPLTPTLDSADVDLTSYALVIWVIYFSYSIILHTGQKMPKEMIEDDTLQEDKNKVVKMTIRQEEIADFADSIISEKLFLDSDLNLAKLSQSCNISRHRASLLLNEGFKSNFYDYINHLRINYSKQLLMDDNYKRNILAVAYDSGFKSRSAFYTAFKKWENKTPSQFLKTLKKIA